MVELNGVRIWAIRFEGGCVTPARKLVCGTLARPTSGRCPIRGGIPLDRLEVPGRPGVSVPWTGWFELATGEVVAVYGAKVEPVG